MKNKLYQTTKKKTLKEKLSFTIQTNLSKIPNKMHLEAQINNPARVHEDKRFKKPKHKKKAFEEE
jgi:hypothetical protein